jgi:glycosyltransferase involved in cell wall biosynthesis
VRALTIAVCTRDRPADLERCIRAVLAAQTPDDVPVEVLIVDDGELPVTLAHGLEQAVRNRGHRFNYVRQEERHGLIHGRITAVREAVSDVLLFLDDDVEIHSDYLKRLAMCYRDHRDAVGIGGVDTLTGMLPGLKRFFATIFLLDSGVPGKLSASGFSWSMLRWGSQSHSFQTEVLSGCNMSFRRRTLQMLAAVPWLEGYSLGEDIYLSSIASSHGPLWVDPALRVRHHRSSASRMAGDELAYFTIVNPYHLLRVRGATSWNYAALLWTSAGFVLKDVLRPRRWAALPGYVRGLRHIFGLLRARRIGDGDRR